MLRRRRCTFLGASRDETKVWSFIFNDALEVRSAPCTVQFPSASNLMLLVPIDAFCLIHYLSPFLLSSFAGIL